MTTRILLPLAAVFWVVMNFLLWRMEYGAREADGEAVPLELVWRKILTSPDASSLGVWRGEERLGFAHWATSIGEEFAALEEAPAEAELPRVLHYQLRLDGNLAVPGGDLRLRYELALKLTTNQVWQEFSLRLVARPTTWELRAVAAEQALHFRMVEGDREFTRRIPFAEFKNPGALLAEFGGPAAPALVGAMGFPLNLPEELTAARLLRWQATTGYFKIGREPVRVYRLHTRLLDRFDVRVLVSRAGEILRVELPDNLVLRHDQLERRAAAAP